MGIQLHMGESSIAMGRGGTMKIAIYAGFYNYWGHLHPMSLYDPNGKQLGGGETAAMNVALGLADLGHDVVAGVYSDKCHTFRGVRFIPEQQFVPFVKTAGFDVVVSWDAIQLYRFHLDSLLNVVAYQLNHTDVGVFDYVVDAYFHPSAWHAVRFAEVYGVPPKKQYIYMTNGVDPQLYNISLPRSETVLYCSSPDRGLHHLLEWWPRIKEDRPNARLHIYYDMEKWLRISQGKTLITSGVAQEVATRLKALLGDRSMGVEYYGGVSKPRLAAAMAEGAVLVYPCDPVAPTEGFSMTILDAWRSGLNIVTTDADALGELWGGKVGINVLPMSTLGSQDIWHAAILAALDRKPPSGPRDIPKRYYWREVCQKWTTVIKELF